MTSLFLGVTPALYSNPSGAAFALAAAPFGSLGAEVPALQDALVDVDPSMAGLFSEALDTYRTHLEKMNLDRLRGSQRHMAWMIQELTPEQWGRVLADLEAREWPLRGGFLATPAQGLVWEGSLRGLRSSFGGPWLKSVWEEVEPPLKNLVELLYTGAQAFSGGNLPIANPFALVEVEKQETILDTFARIQMPVDEVGLITPLYSLFQYTGHLFGTLFLQSEMFGRVSPLLLENWVHIRRVEAASLIALQNYSDSAESEQVLAELSTLLAQTIEADGRVPPEMTAEWYVNAAGAFAEAAEYYAIAGNRLKAAKGLLNALAAYSKSAEVCIAAGLFGEVAPCRERQEGILRKMLLEIFPGLPGEDQVGVMGRLIAIELCMADNDITMFEKTGDAAKANAVRRVKLESFPLYLDYLLLEERWEEARDVDGEARRTAVVLLLFDLSENPARTREAVEKLEQMSTTLADRLAAVGQRELALLSLMNSITGLEGTLLNEGIGGNEYAERFLALLRESVGRMYARAEEILKGLQKWDDVAEALRRVGTGFFRQDGKPMGVLETFLKYYPVIITLLGAPADAENLVERLQWHRQWLSKVSMENGEFMEQVAGARPRVEEGQIVFYDREGKALPRGVEIPPGLEEEVRRRFAMAGSLEFGNKAS